MLWQEGHTAHESAVEAEKETLLILELYRKLAEEYLAMPVHTGLKSESEKFAGADFTYCIEAMMKDKRALQAGTSHNLGQNFAKAFGVTFQSKDNKEEYVYATSWGVSTRLVGGVIMTHGDEKGLRLPPKIAPYQLVLVPIFKSDDDKETIEKFVTPILDELKKEQIRIHEDWRKESPGFKFNEWEMRGAPIRLEIGLRDIEKNCAMVARRDNNEKKSIAKNMLTDAIISLLGDIQSNLFNQALQFREESTFSVDNYDDFKKIIKETGGFIRCGWDGTKETEQAIKDETKATIRVIPFDENPKKLVCVYSGKPAKHEVLFAKAY